MSSPDALQTLLTVRQAAEDGSSQALAGALRRRAAAQEVQERLEVELGAARDDLRARRQATRSLGVETAAQAADRERFWQRLAEGIAARADRARAHRDGPLAEAEASATAARETHRATRAARELVQKLLERADADRRQIAERRAEAALDDQAAARARVTRSRRSPVGGSDQ